MWLSLVTNIVSRLIYRLICRVSRQNTDLEYLYHPDVKSLRMAHKVFYHVERHPAVTMWSKSHCDSRMINTNYRYM